MSVKFTVNLPKKNVWYTIYPLTLRPSNMYIIISTSTTVVHKTINEYYKT